MIIVRTIGNQTGIVNKASELIGSTFRIFYRSLITLYFIAIVGRIII